MKKNSPIKKPKKEKNLAVIFVSMVVIYLFLIYVVMIFSKSDVHAPAYIDLTQSAIYLRTGFDPWDLTPDLKPLQNGGGTGKEHVYVDISDKPWRISDTGMDRVYPTFTVLHEVAQEYTYLVKFDCPVAKTKDIKKSATPMALYIPGIADNYEVYLNGNLLWKDVQLTEDGSIAVHKNKRGLTIPFDRENLQSGQNSLMIHVYVPSGYSRGGLYYNNGMYIDDYRSIQRLHSDIDLLFLISVHIFLAFYSILVLISGNKEKYYLWFAMTNFFFAGYMLLRTHVAYMLSNDSFLLQKTEYMFFVSLGVPLLFFIYAVYEKPLGLLARGLAVITIVFELALLFNQDLQFQIDLLHYGQILETAAIVLAYVINLFGMRETLKQYKMSRGEGISSSPVRRFFYILLDSTKGNIFFGVHLVFFVAIAAIVQSMVFATNANSVFFGMFAFSVSVSFALALDVTRTKKVLENQNKNLDEVVQQRTTRLRLQAEKLKEQTKLAETANKYKSQFLATMSHEIRTPMNAIMGMSEIMMKRSDLPDHDYDNLEKIQTAGSGLLAIINDILDLSKIEAGRMTIEPAEYELIPFIRETVNMNVVRRGNKPIEFIIDVAPDLPVSVIGDVLRVKQILNNILSNAFKYTKKGEVTFRISCRLGDYAIEAEAEQQRFAWEAEQQEDAGSAAEYRREVDSAHKRKTDEQREADAAARAEEEKRERIVLVFEVKDTGLGMTPEELKNLFSEYARFNMSANRETEGTGLGMSITKQLLTLMQGRLYVESDYGKGSTFAVHLPQEIVSESVIGEEAARALVNSEYTVEMRRREEKFAQILLPDAHILVVDDVEINIMVVEGLIEGYGMRVDTATNGQEAIDKVADWLEKRKHSREGEGSNHLYDMILMDHMMPGMDGIEAARRIRDLGYKGFIVALTANALTGQKEIFLEHGFDGFLSKPIDTVQMDQVLRKCLLHEL
ncbi:hypothetical protein FACS1894111_10940 [Clostridia bacterium]|nr:hypothetical protein FACS1894111_10940 [Clostridia bacterium]